MELGTEGTVPAWWRRVCGRSGGERQSTLFRLVTLDRVLWWGVRVHQKIGSRYGYSSVVNTVFRKNVTAPPTSLLR
jgi:hypothetical protein